MSHFPVLHRNLLRGENRDNVGRLGKAIKIDCRLVIFERWALGDRCCSSARACSPSFCCVLLG